ncbi:hypothetical protein SBADM41S_04931 [Streptomyces badius]
MAPHRRRHPRRRPLGDPRPLRVRPRRRGGNVPRAATAGRTTFDAKTGKPSSPSPPTGARSRPARPAPPSAGSPHWTAATPEARPAPGAVDIKRVPGEFRLAKGAGRRRDLRRRQPLLGRLQRHHGRGPLLRDRRTLHQHLRQLVGRRRPGHRRPGGHQLPDQRLRHRPLHRRLLARRNRFDLTTASTRDITSAANAVVGQAIQKSGSTTKLTSGTVTAVNVTVNYGDGPVYNMVRTTACSARRRKAAARTSPDPWPSASTPAAPAARAPRARPSTSRSPRRSRCTA